MYRERSAKQNRYLLEQNGLSFYVIYRTYFAELYLFRFMQWICLLKPSSKSLINYSDIKANKIIAYILIN